MAVLCPQTYMNDAGRSVGPARGAFKLPLERVLVVHDEIDLPFGEVRTRRGGGLAGHNGLKSIRRELGGADFMRVRVGVGRPDSTDPEIVSAYVLGRFREDDAAGERARSSGRASRSRSAGARQMAPEAPIAALAAGTHRGDESAKRLAREGGHAFVSGALRPYMIAALADVDESAAGAADAGGGGRRSRGA